MVILGKVASVKPFKSHALLHGNFPRCLDWLYDVLFLSCIISTLEYFTSVKKLPLVDGFDNWSARFREVISMREISGVCMV